MRRKGEKEKKGEGRKLPCWVSAHSFFLFPSPLSPNWRFYSCIGPQRVKEKRSRGGRDSSLPVGQSFFLAVLPSLSFGLSPPLRLDLWSIRPLWIRTLPRPPASFLSAFVFSLSSLSPCPCPKQGNSLLSESEGGERELSKGENREALCYYAMCA